MSTMLLEANQSASDLLFLKSCFFIPQVSSKFARVVADVDCTLVDNIKMFFLNLFQHYAERVGFDPKQGESHLDALLRGELCTTLVVLGHEKTLKEAHERFQALLEDRNTHLLPLDIRRVNF